MTAKSTNRSFAKHGGRSDLCIVAETRLRIAAAASQYRSLH